MKLTSGWKFTLSISWLLLTIAFAVWWLINSLHLINLNSSFSAEEVSRYRFMLISEGVAWVILLLIGGCTLIYFVYKEMTKNEETRNFVASFSHDLKTSIASLRLQAESLQEDVKDADSQVLLKRLVDDSLRLQIQLENSLEFASQNRMKLHLEPVNINYLISSLSFHWPDINLQLDNKEAEVVADKRAIDIIMRNIIYNAKVHGDAKTIYLNVKQKGDGQVIEIKNDGSAFKGEVEKLGSLYYRHNPSSGSGLGLYIVSSLMKMMSGHIEFANDPFTIQLHFKGAAS